jgi:hypothetical protein
MDIERDINELNSRISLHASFAECDPWCVLSLDSLVQYGSPVKQSLPRGHRYYTASEIAPLDNQSCLGLRRSKLVELPVSLFAAPSGSGLPRGNGP